MLTFARRWLRLLPALILGACTAVPTNEQVALWTHHQARVAEFDRWLLTGKVALRNQQEAGIARFYWRQLSSEQILHLYANLGRHLRLNINADGAELHDSKGENFSAPTLEALLAENTDWPLPGDPLAFWVRGLPAPGRVQTTLDPSGRLQQLKQFGWQVDYDDYRSAVGHPLLPHRLDLRQVDGTGNREIKLIIWHWEPAQDG